MISAIESSVVVFYIFLRGSLRMFGIQYPLFVLLLFVEEYSSDNKLNNFEHVFIIAKTMHRISTLLNEHIVSTFLFDISDLKI